MRKIGKYLLSVLPLFVMLLIQVAASLGMWMAYVLIYGIEDGIVQYLNDNIKILTVIHGLNLLIMGFWYYLLVARRKGRESFAGKFDWKCVGYMVMLGFGGQLLIALLLGGWQILFPSMIEEYSQMIEESGVAQIDFLSILATVLLAPVGEEFVFRGLTLEYLKRAGARFWVANVAQALFFAIAHMNLVQGAYAFLLGLLCGYLVLKYESLLAGIVLHLIFNGYGTFVTPVLNLIFGGSEVEWTIASAMIYYAVCLVLGIFLFAHGIRLVKRDLRAKEEKQKEQEQIA